VHFSSLTHALVRPPCQHRYPPPPLWTLFFPQPASPHAFSSRLAVETPVLHRARPWNHSGDDFPMTLPLTTSWLLASLPSRIHVFNQPAQAYCIRLNDWYCVDFRTTLGVSAPIFETDMDDRSTDCSPWAQALSRRCIAGRTSPARCFRPRAACSPSVPRPDDIFV